MAPSSPGNCLPNPLFFGYLTLLGSKPVFVTDKAILYLSRRFGRDNISFVAVFPSRWFGCKGV
ncbi:hypothetical protein SBC2_10190 [Caballeronia sp. SBC2]|nr:hypothetical protein SBC2_10190 [Caballeronia sp. SBC2]